MKYECNQDWSHTHLENSNHEVLKYECDQCEHIAVWQSDLSDHKKSKNEGVRHECDKCEYNATQQSSLTDHKKVKV